MPTACTWAATMATCARRARRCPAGCSACPATTIRSSRAPPPRDGADYVGDRQRLRLRDQAGRGARAASSGSREARAPAGLPVAAIGGITAGERAARARRGRRHARRDLRALRRTRRARSARALRAPLSPARRNPHDARTQPQLFERSRTLIPGGVNSPVRAFGAVGGTPVFFREGRGARLTDVDGRQYIDYVGSWGPLILGHADPEVVAAVQPRPRAACRSARPPSSSWRWRSCSPRPALARAGAPGELGHRGGDERAAPRARLHRPLADGEVRGLLPRPQRFPAGEGGLGRAHVRQSHLGGRAAGARRRRRSCSTTTTRQQRRGRLRATTATTSPRWCSSRSRAT